MGSRGNGPAVVRRQESVLNVRTIPHSLCHGRNGVCLGKSAYSIWKWVLRTGVRPVALILCAVACSACTWNGHGIFQSPEYSKNADGTAVAIRMTGFGINVVTIAPEQGLTIGYMDKTVFYPGPRSDVWEDLRVMQPELSRLQRVEGELTLPDPDGRPLASEARCIGLCVDVGHSQVGVALGLSSHSGLFIPREFNGLAFLRIDDEGTRFAAKEHP